MELFVQPYNQKTPTICNNLVLEKVNQRAITPVIHYLFTTTCQGDNMIPYLLSIKIFILNGKQ
jgi:hypothetical protein